MTDMPVIPAPPDQTAWWDALAVTDMALDILRLAGSDVDAGRVAELVPGAGALVNTRLDRTTPLTAPAPPQLVDALVQVVIELYRRKDAPPAGIDGLLAGSWRPPSADPTAGVRAQLAAHRERQGVG